MSQQQVSLSVVQARVSVQDYLDAGAFSTLVRKPVPASGEAAAGRHLIVYPEDIGLFLLLAGKEGLLAGAATVAKAMEAYSRRHLLRLTGLRLRHRISWARALILAHQRELAEIYFDTFATIAQQSGAYVVAGTTALTDGVLHQYLPHSVPGGPRGRQQHNHRDLYNVSVIFAPDGQPVGVQRKCHLIDLEGREGLDLSPGPPERLAAVDTPLGRLGVAICFDVFHQDVLDRMEALGVQLLVQPSANPVAWQAWQQEEWLEGLADAVRHRSFAYGLNPMLTGELLDLTFAGQSSILARPDIARLLRREDGPLGYTDAPPRPEFLAVAPSGSEPAVLTVQVPHPDST